MGRTVKRGPLKRRRRPAPRRRRPGRRTIRSCWSRLGGVSIRDHDAALHHDDTGWSAIDAGDDHLRNGAQVPESSAAAGALLLRFDVGGDPAVADGWFETIRGEGVDESAVIRGE